IFTIVFGGLAALFSTTSINEVIVYLIGFTLSLFTLAYMYHTKKSKVVYIIAALSGTIILFFTINILPRSNHAADYTWLTLIILWAFFGLGLKAGLIILILNCFTIFYSAIVDPINSLNAMEVSATEESIVIGIEVITSLLLSSFVIYEFIVTNNHFHKKLELANTELQLQNQTINNQNDEKTLLIKEVHHRVKNNLQIVISLLRLQQNEIQLQETQEQLGEAINRITAMSLIHEKLYSGESLSKINLKDYIKDLCQDIMGSFNLRKQLQFDIEVNIEKLDLKVIVPLGLIINELVTNSNKHAFEKVAEARIKIDLSQEGEYEFKMVYFDNGNWHEEKRVTKSFGLDLIETLTGQLNGKCKREINDSGTTFTFQFKR
ncbi:MAG: sensor histidine kinase, partial [Putridiphycobacter sp.]|nr:sensor histidine kinase [Putridiphycobacter sp.]